MRRRRIPSLSLLGKSDRWLSAVEAKLNIHSSLVELELLVFSKLEQSDLKLIKELLGHCQIIDIDPIIKEKTISIKQKTSLKLPDAIVLATAIRFSLPLITADKDFLQSKEKLVVWMDLT